MRKKRLKQQLEDIRNVADENRRKVYDEQARARQLEIKIKHLEQEKKNRELADRIAIALGAGAIWTQSVQLKMEYGHMLTASIDLIGDPDSLYKFCEELRNQS